MAPEFTPESVDKVLDVIIPKDRNLPLVPPPPTTLTVERSWQCDGGQIVFRPQDSRPSFSGVKTEGNAPIALWESRDFGQTWTHVGWWKHTHLDEEGEFSKLDWIV